MVFNWLVSNRSDPQLSYVKKIFDDIIYSNFEEEIFCDDKIVMLKEEMLFYKNLIFVKMILNLKT